MSGHRWMKFWPQDWQSDASLRMCSLAARGLWIECIAIMHRAEPYGHLLVNGTSPTPRQIASIVGATEREVTKLLAELEEAGVFSRADTGTILSRRMVRDSERSQDGREAIARRWANKVDEPAPDRQLISSPMADPIRGPDSLEAEADTEAERKNPPTPKRGSGRPQGFEEFWRYYPRRVGIGAAQKAWPNAVKAAGGDHTLIIDALKCRLHLFDMRDDGRFVPHPSTWLNQQRWRDAIPGVEDEPERHPRLLLS